MFLLNSRLHIEGFQGVFHCGRQSARILITTSIFARVYTISLRSRIDRCVIPSRLFCSVLSIFFSFGIFSLAAVSAFLKLLKLAYLLVFQSLIMAIELARTRMTLVSSLLRMFLRVALQCIFSIKAIATPFTSKRIVAMNRLLVPRYVCHLGELFLTNFTDNSYFKKEEFFFDPHSSSTRVQMNECFLAVRIYLGMITNLTG